MDHASAHDLSLSPLLLFFYNCLIQSKDSSTVCERMSLFLKEIGFI